MGLLLLVRHGRSTANAQSILAGRLPGVLLDEIGQASAKQLGERISNVAIQTVLVSPLERTKQTADLVFVKHPQIIEEPNLIECDYGDWSGQPLAELAKLPEWKTVQETPDAMVFPNGESMQEMADRSVRCILDWHEQLTTLHGDKFIMAAVTHGDIIKALAAHFLGLPLRNFQTIAIDPLSVSAISIGKNFHQVLKLNDTGSDWLGNLASSEQMHGPATTASVGGGTGVESVSE